MKTILFAVVASTLFYGLYAVTLRRSNLFRLRRFYLIGTLIVAMIIPFISIETKAPQAARVSAYVQQLQMPEETVVPQIEVQEASIEPVQAATPSPTDPVTVSPSWNWKDALQALYFVGCAVTLILLIIKLVKTASYYRRSSISDELSTWEMRVRVLAEPDGNLPFSFLRTVFVNPDVFTDRELRQVLAHERVHIRQCHTFDLLFLEALKVVQWFNPIIYLYMRELKTVHEYLADEQVLAQGAPKRDYLELLYKQLCVGKFMPVGNSFRHLLTKKRILMMNQQVKRRVSALWLLALIPITAGLLLVNCHPKEEVSDELIEEEVIEEPICKNPDVMPEFPGGIEQFMNNLFDNIEYPELAKKYKFSGQYMVRFVVEKDGHVLTAALDTTHIKWYPVIGEKGEVGMVRISHFNSDSLVLGRVILEKNESVNREEMSEKIRLMDEANIAEINRAFRAAPACKPAMKDGQPVRCELSLPFFFAFEMIPPLGESGTPKDKVPHIAHYTIDTIPDNTLVVSITSDKIAVENKK